MKSIRIFASIIALTLCNVTFAQTPESIIGKCPAMPSDESIGEYMALGKNAQVEAYFEDLKNANESISKAAVQAQNTKDYVKEQENVNKKQKQMQNKVNSRVEAGKKMMQFMATLTPEQQKKMMSFRKEEDSFNYLKSIGRYDDLRKLMEGEAGAQGGDDRVVSEEDIKLIKMDLSGEVSAASDKISAARAKMQEFLDGSGERTSKAYEDSRKRHTYKNVSKAMDGLWDTEAVAKDMIPVYTAESKQWKKLLTEYMQAIRDAIPVAKKQDRKTNAIRRMAGQDELRPLESAAFARACEYLKAAKYILASELPE